MADDYTIENVGADDYVISNVGAGRHGGRHHGPRGRNEYGSNGYMPDPLFYQIVLDDDGHFKKVADDDTDDAKGSEVAGLFDVIAAPFKAAAKATAHVAGDIVHTANSAAKLAGKAVNTGMKAVNSIPVVGPLAHGVLAITPAAALGGMAASVLSGERIDKAALAAGKAHLAGIKDIAPYASGVVAFVPGVGTGVAAAIAAGTALAEGRTITDSLIAATKNALPGGPFVSAGLNTAVAVAGGKDIGSAAAQAAIKQLPANAQSAVKIAIAAAKGKNVKGAVLQAIRQNLPPAAQKALDVGTALGTARNIQAALVGTLAKGTAVAPLLAQGAKVLSSNPAFAKAANGLAAPAKQGFTQAMGLLSTKAVPAHAIVAMRAAATPAVAAGIDHALKTYVNHFTPDWPSLVAGGQVLRGPWKPVKATANGATKGRLIQNGKITAGYFSRV